MSAGRHVLAVSLAVAAGLGSPAFAETDSPHLEAIVRELRRHKMLRMAELSPKALRALDKEIAALDGPRGDFRAQIRALHHVALFARKMGADAPLGRLEDAVHGMAAEIEGNLEAVGGAGLVIPKAKSAASVRRRITRAVAQGFLSLANARRPGAALVQAAQLLRAYGRLDEAAKLFGKLDHHVALVWVTCDSIGPVGTPYVRGVNCREMLVDGYPRRFLVYVPIEASPYQPGVPAPIVFMFHGSSGTGEQFLTHSGWREKADVEGLVAVFPTALQYRVLDGGLYSTKWNEITLDQQVSLTEKPFGYPPNAPFPADDVKFTGKILDDLEATLPADPARLFASGFSSGGQFTLRLALELNDRIDAASGSSGGVHPSPVSPVNPPIPYAIFFGTEDRSLLGMINEPLQGLPPDPLHTEVPLDPLVLESIQKLTLTTGFALDALSLERTPYATIAQPTFTTFRWATPAAGNTAGNTYELTILDGLTHHYPSGPNDDVRENEHLFDEPAYLWEFFNR